MQCLNFYKSLTLIYIISNYCILKSQIYQNSDSINSYLLFGNQIGVLKNKNLGLIHQNGIFNNELDINTYKLFYEKGLYLHFDSINYIDIQLLSIDSLCNLHIFKPEFQSFNSSDSMFAYLYRGEFKYDSLIFSLYFYSDISNKEIIKSKFRYVVCSPRILYQKGNKYLVFRNDFLAAKKNEDYFYLGVTRLYFLKIDFH